MKAIMMLLAASFAVSSASAAKMVHFATCVAPLMEGEISVSIASDKSSALVSTMGSNYAVTNMNLGPVASFDYSTDFQTERVIIAVDGGHELHIMDAKSKKFKKVADLTCKRN